jgi:hypothetical protein
MNDSDTDTLPIDVKRLGRWAVGKAVKINPGRSKTVNFTRARVKGPLNYISGGPQNSGSDNCKYLVIILHSDGSWADQLNHSVRTA